MAKFEVNQTVKFSEKGLAALFPGFGDKFEDDRFKILSLETDGLEDGGDRNIYNVGRIDDAGKPIEGIEFLAWETWLEAV